MVTIETNAYKHESMKIFLLENTSIKKVLSNDCLLFVHHCKGGNDT